MNNSRTFIVKNVLVSTMAGLVFAGCGDDARTTTGLESVDLSAIPSASGMLATNDSASVIESNLSSQAVSGTAPLITELGADVDTYFYDGALARLIAGTQDADDVNQFWGGTDGGIGGQGACYMAQSVAESVGRMMSAGGSLCYMKKIPSAATGVTLTGATSADVFSQGAANKLVRVHAQNMGGEDDMYVNIKVHGSDSVTSDVYKVELWFCNSNTASGVVDGHEVIEVNKATKVMTSTNYQSASHGYGTSVLTAQLKLNSSGSIVIDPSAVRTATSSYGSEQWGTYKGSISIDANNVITAKRFNTHTWDNQSWVDSNFSVARFSGSSLKTLKFLEGAYKGSNIGGSENHSYGGAVEFQDTHYVVNLASDYYTTASAADMDDAFYAADVTVPDLTALSCGDTADVDVSMDFSDAAVAAISAVCEEERFDDYSMCNSSEVQQAMNNLFQHDDY